MENTKTPLMLDGVEENIYAGFWLRLLSGFFDFLLFFLFSMIWSTFFWHNSYLNYLARDLFSFFLYFWAFIRLVQLTGASPGKRIMGIKIIQINGDAVDLKAALLREIVGLFFIHLGLAENLYLLEEIDHTEFAEQKYTIMQNIYLLDYRSEFVKFLDYLMIPWTLSELLVLLFNKRKRALHDYIAGTVVIKKKYESAIREKMGLDLHTEEEMV